MSTKTSCIWCVFFMGLVGVGETAHANLEDLFSGAVGTPLEQNAARANQRVFDDFSTRLDSLSPSEQAVFETTRELVHTANALLGRGPTEFSLGLDQENLGFALRWTAAEEMAAQESLTGETASGQISNLAGRLSALRFGASGFSLVASGFNVTDSMYAHNPSPRGGGASADDQTDNFSRLGGFLNASFGYGAKDATDVENAFDFDNTEFTLGLDYRLKRYLVIGGAVGATNSEIDFDSTKSIVDGGIKTDALFLAAYGLFSNDRFYLDGSVTFQSADFDMTRRIVYPSLNPDVPGVDETALSQTSSNTITASVSAGVHGQTGRFGWEPFVKIDYQDSTIDGFTEMNTRQGSFDLIVDEQSFATTDVAAGFHLTMTFTPRVAVIVPYVRGEFHSLFGNEVRRISARYDNGPSGENFNFGVPTDEPDDSFYTAAIGLSSVVRGSRVSEDGGRSRGGMQLFIQYEGVYDLENYTNDLITGGFRYEF